LDIARLKHLYLVGRYIYSADYGVGYGMPMQLLWLVPFFSKKEAEL
jgi:hypothetical protein